MSGCYGKHRYSTALCNGKTIFVSLFLVASQRVVALGAEREEEFSASGWTSNTKILALLEVQKLSEPKREVRSGNG